MRLRNCTIDEFAGRTRNKKIVCFGAYVMSSSFCNEYAEYNFEERIVYFVDNDPRKQGKDFLLPNGETRKIFSAEQFASNADKDTVLLICSDYFAAIIDQLDQFWELNELECYIYPFIKYDMEYSEVIPVKHSAEPRIPKTIHYFWFGKNCKGELAEKCIDSWNRYCPDYELIEWNESNYDVTKNNFMKEAYEAGKYAFVTDFARLDIVEKYGGLYFDTDVELIKNIDDLLYNEAFFGLNCYGRIATGLGFGSVKEHKILKRLLKEYEEFSFVKPDGTFNVLTNTIREAPVFAELGLKQKNRFQMLDDAAILPSDFMSPCIPGFASYKIFPNTVSIHHNGYSWGSENAKEELNRSKHEYERIRYRFEHD